jgi:hypothetical protein
MRKCICKPPCYRNGDEKCTEHQKYLNVHMADILGM